MSRPSTSIRPIASARPGDRAPTEVELLRLARAIAAAEGWEVDGSTRQVHGEPPRELRVAVSGHGLPGRCLLRIRDRPRGAPVPAEADVREAAASEHVVGVIAEPADTRFRGRAVDAVLLEYPENGDLDGLLGRPGGVRSGEAATVLIAVAAGLAALHASGWAGPELTGSGIVFLGDGCPALDGLDDVKPWTSGAAVADAERFYGLARTICLKVADGCGMRLLGAVEAGLRRGSWPALTESVLRVVAPEPIRFDTAALADVGGAERGRNASSRAESGRATASGRPVTRDVRGGVRRGVRRGVLGRPGGGTVREQLGGRIAALVSGTIDLLDGRPGRALAEWLRATLRRRPALIAAAAVPVIVAVAFIALSPAPGASQAASGQSTMANSATATSRARDVTEAAVPTPSPRAATSVPTAPAVTPVAAAAETSVAAGGGAGGVASEDPVDAARAVLDARYACFAARPPHPECLTGVLDEASPLLGEEAAALSIQGAAGTRDYSGAQLSLIERWGGAALVSAVPDSARTPKSEPASLLLVRSEAGWRLRAVYP